jgi:hypothetical protein
MVCVVLWSSTTYEADEVAMLVLAGVRFLFPLHLDCIVAEELCCVVDAVAIAMLDRIRGLWKQITS